MKNNFFKYCVFIIFLVLLPWHSLAYATSVADVSKDKKQLIAGHYIYYKEMGQGETILLVHGLFGNKEQWRAMLPLLANHLYHVIALDVPGYGKSLGYPLQDYALDQEVSLIHNFMQKLGIKKFDIAGNSMGGALAALYEQKYPKQIISIAFIGAPLGVISPKPSETDELFKKGLNPFVVTNAADFQRILSLIFIHPPVIDQAKVAQKIQENIAKKDTLKKITSLVSAYRDFFEKPICITVPVLIVWGEKDKIFDVSGATKLHDKLKNSTLVILPGMGHMPQMEAAPATSRAYLSFLKNT